MKTVTTFLFFGTFQQPWRGKTSYLLFVV